MERLTFGGRCNFDECRDIERNCTGCKQLNKMVKKLSEYEDIGTVKGFKDCVVLLKLLSKHGLTPDEVVEFSAAKADGRLAVLPCKVGDMLYWVGMHRGEKRVVEYKVRSFTLLSENIYIFCGQRVQFWDEEIGRKVYLTRAEAEKALREDCDYA
jgi:hypothetical protein